MIGEKKSLKKITMATGVVAMAVGLISAFSFEASAGTTTGPAMGCYIRTLVNCPLGFQRFDCGFTGVYGAPYVCSWTTCLWMYGNKQCVQKPTQ